METLEWVISSKSDGGSCVQVARTGGGVIVRNSNDPDGPSVRFTEAEWRAATDGIQGGELLYDDLP